MLPDDGPTYDQEQSNEYWMGEVDELLDLVTNAHIRDDPNKKVYVDEMTVWESLPFGGSPEEAKAYYTQGGNMGTPGGGVPDTHANIYPDDTIVVNQQGAAFDEVTWYKFKGQAWKGLRTQFERIIPTFETIFSYDQTGFQLPILRMELTRESLTPRADITEADVDELSKVDVQGTGDNDSGSQASNKLDITDEWDAAQGAADFLDPWTGRAAEIFTATYINRLPSILLGQTMTARVLEDSLKIVSDAYTGIRWETTSALYDAISLFELYPAHRGASSSPTDWKSVLANVAGVATVVAGVATWVPGGQPVAAIATIVAGGASIGSNVVKSPKHKEGLENEVKLEGDTAVQIFDNFEKKLLEFIAQVDNTEQVLSDNLTSFKTVLDDKTTSGVTLYLHFGDDVTLTQYESFFCPKKPALAGVSPGDTTSNDNMGAAPSQGASFSADLNGLFKTADIYLPDLAFNYEHMSGSSADEGLDDSFGRQESGFNPAVGEYTYTAQGKVYPIWMEVHGVFKSMLAESGQNLRLTSDALRKCAIAYAQQDTDAAKGLDDAYQVYL